MFLYIKRNKSGFPWIFMEPENWFPMISGHGTQKLLSMAFEILGLGITLKVALQKSEVLLNHKIFKKILIWFYTFSLCFDYFSST